MVECFILLFILFFYRLQLDKCLTLQDRNNFPIYSSPAATYLTISPQTGPIREKKGEKKETRIIQWA